MDHNRNLELKCSILSNIWMIPLVQTVPQFISADSGIIKLLISFQSLNRNHPIAGMPGYIDKIHVTHLRKPISQFKSLRNISPALVSFKLWTLKLWTDFLQVIWDCRTFMITMHWAEKILIKFNVNGSTIESIAVSWSQSWIEEKSMSTIIAYNTNRIPRERNTPLRSIQAEISSQINPLEALL